MNDLNVSDDVTEDSYHVTTLEVILIIPDILVFIIGIIGNGTLCLIIFANQSMRTRHNTLICNLAVGDLIFLLFNVPIKIIHTFNPTIFDSVASCKMASICSVITIAVSSLSIAALSAERYFASATARNTTMTVLKLKKIVVPTIWICAIICSIPVLVLAKIMDHGGKTYCQYMPVETSYAIAYEVMIGIALIIIPLIITVAFYLSMARKLVRDYSEMSAGGSSSREENSVHHDSVSRQRRERGRQSLAATVIAIAVIFGICWLPITFFNILIKVALHNEMWYILDWPGLHALGQVLGIFSHMNSCVNPIVLYIRSRTYHTYFNKYLCYCCTNARRYMKPPVST
ncbi:endothelin receptor type B-like [Anneissia japonica]|uniref:endothelin receptor type B-like n=1 Tax=Anneissia japonica TaxID=1529436 RepID=UPI001425AE12|nr:endothelin receptor type B-like [Anneissia japonica]